MTMVVKFSFGSSLVLTAGLCTMSFNVSADDALSERELKLRPSTTLSAAANAANSAVKAANAAAAAASAAATAAGAAVDAINAILPPSQRLAPASSFPFSSVANTPIDPQAKLPATPFPGLAGSAASQRADPLDDGSSARAVAPASQGGSRDAVSDGRFAVPVERSLVGMVGTYEVPVAVDLRGEFAAGVRRFQVDGADQVGAVGAIDLAQAVRSSLGFSRDVLIASARVEQARAQTGQAKAFLLPSLLLSTKTGREVSNPGVQIDPLTGSAVTRSDHSRSDISLTLRQPLLDLPSLYDWKRRKVVETSRDEGVRSSEGDAYLATVTAYLGLVSTRVQANMASDYEAQMQELFQYIDKRAGAGAASNSDKERVRARSLSARSSRIEQEAAHAAAGVEFVRLVNLVPGTLRLPDMEDVGISIVPPSLEQAIPLAIESNPDIAVLQAELKAAEIDQSAAKSRYLPRLDLEYSRNDSTHAGGADGSQRDQRLMLVMNWSIFSGGGDVKFNDEKAARRTEMRYRLDDQHRRVLQALSAQYATVEATRQRIATGYRELESIASAGKAMSSRMVSGNQSLLDMLDVYDRFYQARTRLVALHAQEMGAVAQIARLVQGTPRIEGVASVQKVSRAGSVN